MPVTTEPYVVEVWTVEDLDYGFDASGEFGPDIDKLGKLAVRFTDGTRATLNVERGQLRRPVQGLTRAQLVGRGLLPRRRS